MFNQSRWFASEIVADSLVYNDCKLSRVDIALTQSKSSSSSSSAIKLSFPA